MGNDAPAAAKLICLPDAFTPITNSPLVFYLNNRDGTFTKITEGNLVNSGGASNGAVFTDYERDGFLDLFVANRCAASFRDSSQTRIGDKARVSTLAFNA